MAVLVSFVHPGHILVYAPGDVLTSPPCHRRNDLADSLLRHPSACGCVGFVRPPRSHTGVCSRGCPHFTALPQTK
ncbi:hypothetical protein AM380_11565 [Morganella morganii]|uniref:Uncharacterized protein n=1 Tax=Morganella morganii TaxID=582 RepID=A0AAU8ZML5_MORMO|nr:hypothetical protein AM380_11565 [Morganella morganii]